MPKIILDDLAQSQVSIFAAQTQPGELGSRIEMTAVVNKHHIRHGHMVNINRQIMLEGMRADFCAVDALSQRLVERARQVERITCKTPHGTEFEAEFSPKLKWLKTSGIITPDKWGNLPGGEIFTSPMNTNGVFVVDGVVGDYLCERYGDLQSNPLTIEVENNRIRSLRSENKELLDEFRAYTSTDENSNRVGEFAIGTNTACTHVIGHILQDEKIPGVHIAFGHPYAEHTGANWVSKTHIDCVGPRFRHLVRRRAGDAGWEVFDVILPMIVMSANACWRSIRSIRHADVRWHEHSFRPDHAFITPRGNRVIVVADNGATLFSAHFTSTA